MDLIVKPTDLCNFNCTFCSSPKLSKDSQVLDINHIFEFLKKFPNTNTIIINGGDPLVISPSYYWEILEWIEVNQYDTTLSFTTNLWDFYKRPDKWIPLFKHHRVGITTSFNYGDSRRITEDRVYTELDFWNISNLFVDNIGYRPDFISVVDYSNNHLAVDHVRLAKLMGVECKLNPVLSSGLANTNLFLLADIYQIYLDIYDQGLTPWEYNTQQLVDIQSGTNTTCPLHRKCDEGIRTLHPDGSYYSCGAFADDGLYAIEFESEAIDNITTPLQADFNVWILKPECFQCPNYQICNGCYKQIADLKRFKQVDIHCNRMMKLTERLQNVKAY